MDLSDAHLEYPLLKDVEWLEHQYITRELEKTELSNIIGCDCATLDWWFDKHDIKVRNDSEHSSNIQYPELHNEDWLRSKYIDEDMTSKEISDLLDCSPTTVRSRLSDLDIHKTVVDPTQICTQGWLEEKYVEERESKSDIADMLGVSKSMVTRICNEMNISRGVKYPKLRDEDWLQRKWEDELLAPKEIGELADGASTVTVRRWLSKHDLF